MAVYFSIGDLVEFDYRAGAVVHDSFPKVLCLHNNWRGCVHGLNFNYLTQQEINYIKSVLNPQFAKKISKKDLRIAAQLDRISHLANLNITSPHDFYVRFIRGFIQPRGWEPYRRYNVQKIGSSKIITRQAIMTGEEKSGIFDKYRNKFKNMRGSSMGRDQQTEDYRASAFTHTDSNGSGYTNPVVMGTNTGKPPTKLSDL